MKKDTNVYDVLYEVLYGGESADDAEATAQALHTRGLTSEMIEAEPADYRLLERRFEERTDDVLEELWELSKTEGASAYR